MSSSFPTLCFLLAVPDDRCRSRGWLVRWHMATFSQGPSMSYDTKRTRERNRERYSRWTDGWMDGWIDTSKSTFSRRASAFGHCQVVTCLAVSIPTKRDALETLRLAFGLSERHWPSHSGQSPDFGNVGKLSGMKFADFLNKHHLRQKALLACMDA